MSGEVLKQKALDYLKRYETGSSWMIGLYLKIGTISARRLMRRMERDGLVRLNERYTEVNNLVWELVQ